jgi:hypothetical protein
MTRGEALAIVNGNLDVGAGVTLGETKRLKCWVPDSEGGVNERYLDEADCMDLAAAFIILSVELKKANQPTPQSGTSEGGGNG